MNEFTEDAFIVGTMRWSFSRLNSFDTCQYEWHRVYIDATTEKDDSAMAQFGSLIHSILEKYAKGELDIFELSQYYEEHFNEVVTYDFPPNKYVDLRQKYYEQGLDYLDNINLDLDRYNILGVEREVNFDINGYDCIGFIDLLLQDKDTGEIIIEDHKSASIKILKSGAVSKKDREHFESFKKQLYLYAKPIIEEYGHVDKLKWNLFKEQRFIEIPFDQKEYEASIIWAADTINRIENETEWGINKELIKAREENKYPPFYCMNLCSIRYHCPYKYEQLEMLRIMNEGGD
jgi:hypothetical protein